MGRCMGRCMACDGGVGTNALCILPGLVGLDLGYREGLDRDGEVVIGVVSGCGRGYLKFMEFEVIWSM